MAFGGHLEIDPGLWALFAVEANDEGANLQARSLLGGASFAYGAGLSADDRWMLYYVDSASRPAAVHWLDDLAKVAAGEIRPVSPAHQAMILEIIESDHPHRAARKFANLHESGEISAGLIREPSDIRSLLDRLHVREPLFFTAFQSLLTHHLIDMVVLLRQLITEDVTLKNEIVKSGLSADPFLQSRQDAAAEIRNILIRFRVINPLDQQKNTGITNPYAAFMEIERTGDQITATIEGLSIAMSRDQYLTTLRSIRRTLYRGESFGSITTQAPWMDEDMAYGFRFIKQRIDGHREIAPLDSVYMLERAVESRR